MFGRPKTALPRSPRRLEAELGVRGLMEQMDDRGVSLLQELAKAVAVAHPIASGRDKNGG